MILVFPGCRAKSLTNAEFSAMIHDNRRYHAEFRLTMEERNATNPAVGAPRPPVSEAGSAPSPRRRFRLGYFIFFLIVLAAIIATAVYYAHFIAPYETTDDAFIESHVTFVSPRVSGPVVKLLAMDNQRVKAGDVLLEIDPQRLPDARGPGRRRSGRGATAMSRRRRRKLSLTRPRPSSKHAARRLRPGHRRPRRGGPRNATNRCKASAVSAQPA